MLCTNVNTSSNGFLESTFSSAIINLFINETGARYMFLSEKTNSLTFIRNKENNTLAT